jgi:arylsulfatase A-like enzyme
MCFAALLVVSQGARLALAQAPPNIVLILTDDQSWNGTSVQMHPNMPNSKSDFYQTPRLEQLAAAGMRFSNGYSATPVCATTRAALQTGRSTAQLQMTDMPHALPPGTARWLSSYEGLPLTPPMPEVFDPNNYTLPRIIKDANPNYVTGHLGKWHLDVPISTTPQAVGYDFGGDVAPLPPDNVDPWGVFTLAGRANSFMQDRVNNNQPFFLQVSYKAVHDPIRSRDVIRQKYENLPPGALHKNPAYAAMTEDLDTSVGMVMDKIQELGIADNTYIIYVSDNGAPLALSSNAPLREGKATVREGGIRIPFVVAGPGVQPGSHSSVPVVTTDLYSTIASLAGRTAPLPSNVEGASLAPILHNGGQLPAGMDHLSRNFHDGGEIYFHWPMNFGVSTVFRVKPSSAVRDGDYKLFVEWGENGGEDKLYLYNLATDISESFNLALTMPAKTAELKGKLDNYLAAVDAPMAYDVKAPVHLAWNAGHPGAEAIGWRSTLGVNYKGRETWALGGGAENPVAVDASAYQPGLSGRAFSFDGDDVMRRRFFHVSDRVPRRTTPNAGTADFDRSAAVDLWFRAANLNHNQVLFESGDATSGLSLTLGDADANGSFNDLRFRVRGANGQSLDVTVPINSFANPVTDFIHTTAVFSDNDSNRYLELYVNGALAGRVNGLSGSENSLQWDGYDQAGLGKAAGAGLGANGGTGALPFNGGFTGQIAAVNFWNHAVTSSTIASNYNAMLDHVALGVRSLGGDSMVPFARPTSVRLGSSQSGDLQVIEERRGFLSSPLAVDVVVNGPLTIMSPPGGADPQLAGGTGFTSYLLHFDPLGSNAAATETVAGAITFDKKIIGIQFDATLLAASDAKLGSIGDYGVAADRGLAWASGDFLSIGSDQRTLSFNLSVMGNELLQFRVLTETIALSPADFNFDGVVDASDLLVWKSDFRSSVGGDTDGDGDSDGHDFLAWQRQLGSTATASSAAGAVPEPTSGALAGLLVAVLAACQSRRRFRRS